jgi:hypothetical protein
MLTLQNILAIGGIPAHAGIKLFRHTPTEKSVEEAWKNKWLHEYERMHGSDFKVPDYTVTFIPVPRRSQRAVSLGETRRWTIGSQHDAPRPIVPLPERLHA